MNSLPHVALAAGVLYLRLCYDYSVINELVFVPSNGPEDQMILSRQEQRGVNTKLSLTSLHRHKSGVLTVDQPVLLLLVIP